MLARMCILRRAHTHIIRKRSQQGHVENKQNAGQMYLVDRIPQKGVHIRYQVSGSQSQKPQHIIFAYFTHTTRPAKGCNRQVRMKERKKKKKCAVQEFSRL